MFKYVCCNDNVLWPSSLLCPEVCDSLLCFKRFSIKVIIQCVPFSFKFFLL